MFRASWFLWGSGLLCRLLRFTVPLGNPEGQSLSAECDLVSAGQDKGDGNCFPPSPVLSFCLSRPGGVEKVRSPMSHEKIKPKWNLVTAAIDNMQNEHCICCFPKYYLLVRLLILVECHIVVSVLKTNKKCSHPSLLVFQFKIALASNLTIQFPFLGLHFLPFSWIIPFYCLTSLKITSCFHATNQVLTWLLQVPQCLYQCLFFSPEGIY